MNKLEFLSEIKGKFCRNYFIASIFKSKNAYLYVLLLDEYLYVIICSYILSIH
jgi:hypothetical protein